MYNRLFTYQSHQINSVCLFQAQILVIIMRKWIKRKVIYVEVTCVLLKFISEMRPGYLTMNFCCAGRYVFQYLRTDMLHTISSLFQDLFILPLFGCSVLVAYLEHHFFFFFFFNSNFICWVSFPPCCKFLDFFRLLCLSLGESCRGRGGREKWDVNKIVKLLTLTIKHHFSTNITNKI